jgi:hypothetical protein
LKNRIETEQLKKIILKKKCKNHNLNHETRINLYKKLEDNHKTNVKKKLMQNNKIVRSRIPNKLNVKK